MDILAKSSNPLFSDLPFVPGMSEAPIDIYARSVMPHGFSSGISSVWVVTDAYEQEVLSRLPKSDTWLYYPEEIVDFLNAHGLCARVNAHSGKTLIAGEPS